MTHSALHPVLDGVNYHPILDDSSHTLLDGITIVNDSSLPYLDDVNYLDDSSHPLFEPLDLASKCR